MKSSNASLSSAQSDEALPTPPFKSVLSFSSSAPSSCITTVLLLSSSDSSSSKDAVGLRNRGSSYAIAASSSFTSFIVLKSYFAAHLSKIKILHSRSGHIRCYFQPRLQFAFLSGTGIIGSLCFPQMI